MPKKIHSLVLHDIWDAQLQYCTQLEGYSQVKEHYILPYVAITSISVDVNYCGLVGESHWSLVIYSLIKYVVGMAGPENFCFYILGIVDQCLYYTNLSFKNNYMTL